MQKHSHQTKYLVFDEIYPYCSLGKFELLEGCEFCANYFYIDENAQT